MCCDLGKVVDLSAGGVCVRSRHRPGQEGGTVSLTLDCGSGAMRYVGTIVRLRRKGLFGWEAGIRFDELTEHQKRELSRMALSAASAEITDWARAS